MLTKQPFLHFIWVIICFLVINNNAVAQSLKITDENDKGIPDVFIYDLNNKASTSSNKNGRANLEQFSKKDTIVLQHPSFERKTILVSDLENETTRIKLTPSLVQMPEFVLSASRTRETEDEIPYKIESINARKIEQLNVQTTADMLQGNGTVLVQKSQLGGGSPIIRGFEASRLLMVIDGVRMNNAIYRSGHLQNAITIDQSVLERTEVVYGPSSVMYGSDALGGVIHFYSKNPTLSETDSMVHEINAYTRFSSANNEITGHIDLEIGWKKWGLLTSISNSKFGDLRMGSNRMHGYDEWGKSQAYVTQFNGIDSTVNNSNPAIQKFTGYQQMDLLQKIIFQPNDKLDFTLNIQYSTSSDIPRYDRLNDYSGDNLKFAEWHYGPQERLFTAFTTNLHKNTKIYDGAKLTLAFQNINESRINRRFRSDNRIERLENVKAYSFNADFRKAIGKDGRLNYGIESLFNGVTSTANSINILTNDTSYASTRYPDNGSTMNNASIYLAYKHYFSKYLIFNSGIRYNYISYQSDFSDTNVIKLPFNTVDFANGAITGSAGLNYNPNPKWQIRALLSSGFRSPNVDDYGKIFDKDDNVVIPTDQLNPEYAYNGELGITRYFFSQKLQINATGFYTLLTNAIVRRNATVNGVDSLLFEGDLLNLQTNQNTNKATIYGASLVTKINFNKHISADGTFNYTLGEDITDKAPLGHIPPIYGKISANYQRNKVQASLYSFYNGWKRLEDFSPSGTDNEAEATEDGYPSWYTLNTKFAYQLSESISVMGTVENILDTHYKTFASGISAPGRNFVLTVRGKI